MPPRDPPFNSKYSHTFSATYLESLRSYRPARPTGSRPPPFTPRTQTVSSESSLTRSDSLPTVNSVQSKAQPDESEPYTIQSPPIPNSSSISSAASLLKGRPLAQPPANDRPILRGRKVSPTAIVQVPQLTEDGVYLESVSRRLEKQEAHNLREALQLIDHKDDENRIYQAAQDEAADLVWKHQNPHAAEVEKTAAYRNPDLKVNGNRRSSGQRKASGTRKVSFPNPESQIYEEPEQQEDRSEKPIKTPSTGLPLRIKSTNTLPWLKKRGMNKPDPAPMADNNRINRVEIHKNPPTRSRDAQYTANTPPRHAAIDTIEEVETPKSSTSTLEIRGEDIRAATSMKRKDRSPNLPTPVAVSDHVGRPIVSFDPSWKPSNDSPRASQDVERPIIKLTERPTPQKSSERPLPTPGQVMPEVTVSAPAVPRINLPDDPPVPLINVCAPGVPTINLPEQNNPVPSINIGEEGTNSSSFPTINLPGEIKQHARPLPKHAATTPTTASSLQKAPSSRLPWLHRHPMPTVSCSSCALPISGRIVTAAGSSSSSVKARFHPECFTCYHCATPLECVSFYPEPDEKRLDRLESMGIEATSPEASNDPLRFYCHLDFHEFFSPRCRSCKTPIEGEVIVAAGAEWHVGHFFCAECGDPFDSSTPFVERDNYAYCVSCHTKRTSARCRRCKQQILDELTVEALGGKYHETCFVCFECGGGFGDEGRFFVRDVDVEPTDKERRKGITRKIEEKAVCGPCEERRLKA
ncbi:hypothetical protein PV08_08253 [Exophiala spinifera]|uniref:LIM zinc-binding domain-containing protein n=1 Tax=Exophiala spinifera TaxID=91928 RepID=A0A0D1YDK2_9EURO|nr:uncharacterized protein PV08_08253 [Exophiala spinifera]KIW13066.1 hypothetical protein PV08_08253 [Exophiala spinifera]